MPVRLNDRSFKLSIIGAAFLIACILLAAYAPMASGIGPGCGGGEQRIQIQNGEQEPEICESICTEFIGNEQEEISGLFFIGTGADENISGTDGQDILVGNGGRDKISGHKGRDLIIGGPGNDKLNGQNEDDIICGDSGEDKIAGENGNDLLYGGDDNDRIYGKSGNDDITAGAGNDKIDGGLDDDSCDGGADTDTAVRCEDSTNIP